MAGLFPAKFLLCLFGLVGLLGTWVRTARDGSTVLLMQAMDDPNYTLPGTQTVLRRTFTGIYPIDHLLSVLVLFWHEAVDGSHPATTAISVYFLGQLLPCIVIIYMNGQRGRAPSLVKPTLWLIFFQCCAVGATGPIWALSYITSSPTVQFSKDTAFDSLRSASIVSYPPLIRFILFPAVLFGYLAPAALMGILSSYSDSNDSSNTPYQVAIAVWNFFPLVILPIIYILRPVLSQILGNTSAVATPKNKSHIRAVRAANIPTIILSSTMHITIVSTSLMTVLFPSIFQPKYVQELSPAALFLPPLAIGPQALSPGDGARGFLLWDQVAGYLTVMLVVMTELRTVWAAKEWTFRWSCMIPAAAAMSLILGPGSVCLLVSWLRDEILFGDRVEEKERTKRAGKI